MSSSRSTIDRYREALLVAVSEARPFAEAVRELGDSLGLPKSDALRVRLSVAAAMLQEIATREVPRMDPGTVAAVMLLLDDPR